MKKLVTIFFIAALFAACEKENDSLAGTTWTTSIEQTHNENGKTYPYTRDIELSFSSDTRGAFVFKSASLPDNITLDAFTTNFSYTFNGSSGTAVFEPNKENIPFTVSGNKLRMTVKLQAGIELSLDLTKK